ncbi:hypothetical protein KAU11_03730 [Candidatus Babeliales bacterium]|nr:hypothetical protein [Candidatus Babeliales bacterium]
MVPTIQTRLSLVTIIMALSLCIGCARFTQKKGAARKTPSYRYQKPETPRKHKTIPRKQQTKPIDPETMSRDELLKHYLEATGEKRKIQNQGKLRKDSLDFLVKNGSGNTIFVTCFSYIKKSKYQTWRWDKSPIYKMYPGDEIVIDIDEIANKRIRKDVFAYLAITNTQEEALKVTPEINDDKRLLDLDLLKNLKGKTILVEVEKYGYILDQTDYRIEHANGREKLRELDFEVENQTGKPVFVTCFVYQQQQDSDEYANWGFAKTVVKRLEPGESVLIDIESIKDYYDWVYMRANLAVFDEHEGQLAEDSVYEKLEPRRKLALGALSTLTHKKVTLTVERYGSAGDFIDYVTRPATKRIKI